MLAMQAELGVRFLTLSHISRSRRESAIHVSHAGRGRGAFSRFHPVALNPALSRSPDHHTFLLVCPVSLPFMLAMQAELRGIKVCLLTLSTRSL